MIVRPQSRRKLGKKLTICSAVVEETSQGLPEVGEIINVVGEGQCAASLARKEHAAHRLAKVELEARRSRCGHRVYRVLEYAGPVELVEQHVEVAGKDERAAVFAAWLVDELPVTRVLDVAGGRGDLSRELLRLGTQKATVVEPAPRRHGFEPTLNVSFEFPVTDAATRDALDDATAVVALHPDEATEAAVCAAAARGLPFAVVPCCVFPSKFTTRRQFWNASKCAVRTYPTFLEYLVQRAKALGAADTTTTALPLQGKNVVVFSKGRTRSRLFVDYCLGHVFSFLDVVVDVALSVHLHAVARHWRFQAKAHIASNLDSIVAKLQQRTERCAFVDTDRSVVERSVLHDKSGLARAATAQDLARHPSLASVRFYVGSGCVNVFLAVQNACKGPAYLGSREERRRGLVESYVLLYCERARLLAYAVLS